MMVMVMISEDVGIDDGKDDIDDDEQLCRAMIV